MQLSSLLDTCLLGRKLQSRYSVRIKQKFNKIISVLSLIFELWGRYREFFNGGLIFFLFRGDSAHFACKPIETMILLIQGVQPLQPPP